MSDDSILITGASSDIGVALVRRLAAGSTERRLICHYKTGRARIEQLQQDLGAGILAIHGDLSSPSGTEAFLQALRSSNLVPRSFVHLPAGKLRYERFGKADLSQLATEWQIQLGALIAILRFCLTGQKHVAEERSRRRVVIALSSVTMGVPPKYLSMYTMIKYAQLGLVRALAAEYGELGVSVNAVSPSMVETKLLSDVPRQIVEISQSQNPMGRNATAADVAGVIEFLLSQEAGFINGANVPVTGGSVF
ncbi:MAG TPA: SDR family oxidoreductase [Thermoanaerobaculia bacterium]|nr:SDR family oxidoreductase [Thermoanaerobaculia bacterium]